MTPEEFRRLGHRLVDWAADYRAGIASRPVGPQVEPGQVRAGLPSAPPQKGEPLDRAIDDLDRLVTPGIVQWQHPRFFGWFPSNGLDAGVLADFVSTSLGVIGLSWNSAPALTEIEEATCDWMRQMCGLSDAFTGVIQDTASTASLVALITARERATGYAAVHGGLQAQAQPLAIYVSAHSHSSVDKAAALAGFGRDHVRQVPTDADHTMRPDALEAMIEEDIARGVNPCAIVATSGTTGVTAFDPLAAIGAIARKHGVWLHLDAAMAGSALILPEMRPLFDGIELADSIIVNTHKWLGVPFDCTLYFVRDPEHLIRVMSTNPSYLHSDRDAEVKNYRDWGIPLGRRFRALKLWFVIREQGVEGLQARLRRDLENAQWFAREVEAAPGWRVVAPVKLQTVCVRHEPDGLEGEALDAHTRAWADRLNASGEAWVTPAVLDGRWMVRISIGALATDRADVEALWSAMRRETHI
ncbi:MAG TPA: aminotransferase class V-fold PLP-dependent enzyme [Caulobacteraceae bacterium]|jgi:aromatic-L-amino-acid decarboxylase|nr:aminotransferase class V-fold PLP-dependent enzyme [Caulobacteraceae bacterium]